ncbi:MAG: hypothetical protein E7K32_16120 [Bacteroides stercoris]|nr:hypothetical protein [Bacteroides stercoris]
MEPRPGGSRPAALVIERTPVDRAGGRRSARGCDLVCWRIPRLVEDSLHTSGRHYRGCYRVFYRAEACGPD